MTQRENHRERERTRQGWHQTLAKLANAYRLLAKNQDLENMAERIEAIKQRNQQTDQQAQATDSDRFRYE